MQTLGCVEYGERRLAVGGEAVGGFYLFLWEQKNSQSELMKVKEWKQRKRRENPDVKLQTLCSLLN